MPAVHFKNYCCVSSVSPSKYYCSVMDDMHLHYFAKVTYFYQFHIPLILLDQIPLNRLAFKSGIDGHLESPQVGHSRPANTSQRLNSFYVVASSD